jgi:hypothetical protein
VKLSEQAAALLDRLRSLSVEAREALSLGTWRREGANPITAEVFARVEWDLPYVAADALAGARRAQSAPRPELGRPGFSSADRDLVGNLAAIWHRLTGCEAKAYYNVFSNPQRQINTGARFVAMAFRLVTRRPSRDHRLIKLL